MKTKMQSIFLVLCIGTLILSLSAKAEEVDEQGWKGNAGLNALIATGNSENTTLGGNSLLSNRWDQNKVSHTAKGAYAHSKDPATGLSSTNTKNWNTELRYDRYINDTMSIFENGHLGQDEPAGFDWKYGGGAGFGHEFIKTDPNFLKYEVGFDYTREHKVVAIKDNVYSARVFLQYKRKISEWASFGQDLENLINLETSKDYRLTSLTSLTMKLTDKLAFQAGFEVRFDNEPVAGAKKTDTETIMGLVIDFI